MELFDLLQTLTEVDGPSGLEQAVSEVVSELWRPLADELLVDRMGNVLAVKHGAPTGERRRLLIATHMDEIAMMVKAITQYPQGEGRAGAYGFLQLTNVGGVDVRHLVGQPVLVHGARPLPGIIGALPRRLLPELGSSDVYGFDELLVDVGLPIGELRELVAVGDFISFRQPLRKLLNDRVCGKAVDNRASVAAATRALELLQERRHRWDVVVAATVQEETRLLGAYTAAFEQRPDAAMAIDVTFAKGPGARDSHLFELDDGPTLGLGVNVHPGMFARLQQAAEALEMSVHLEPHTRSSGTDAHGLQVAREGVPTGVVSIPIRYMHTMVETVALADIERVGRLAAEFAARLDDSFIEEMQNELMGEG